MTAGALETNPGLRDLLGEAQANGLAVPRIRETVEAAFPDLEPTDRTVRRWLADRGVQRIARELAADRERELHRQSRAALAKRLAEGDTGDLSTLDLLRISKDSAPAATRDETPASQGFAGAPAAVADLYRFLSAHSQELPQYPALCGVLGVKPPGKVESDQWPQEEHR